jgi:hypothetical protein
MPSLFPQLFFLSYFVMAIVRFSIGFLFLADSGALWRAGGVKRYFALFSIAIAFALGVGAWTQVVALVAGAYAVYLSLREPDSLFKNKTTLFLALVILLLLFVNGPGPFAIDLPY